MYGLTTNSPEVLIKEMREYYLKNLKGLRNSYSIRKTLQKIIEELSESNPYFNPLGYASTFDKTKWQNQNKIEKFISENFPAKVLDDFNADIVSEEIDVGYEYDNRENIFINFLNLWVADNDKIKNKSKVIAEFKLDFLKFLYACLENGGLHPLINSRKDEDRSYNVFIKFSLNEK